LPIPASIAHAAEDYRFNGDFLANAVKGLSPEEWLKRPNESSNHIAWVVGHVIWARKGVLARLGRVWSAPWLGLFARGATLDETVAYPSAETLIDAWREVSGVLTEALENASEEALAEPAKPPSPPSPDGKVSGVIRFLAYHETYHVGQAAYLRSWLGHKGIMG
jgi:uncharacterized damage-inducible protein DinB